MSYHTAAHRNVGYMPAQVSETYGRAISEMLARQWSGSTNARDRPGHRSAQASVRLVAMQPDVGLGITGTPWRSRIAPGTAAPRARSGAQAAEKVESRLRGSTSPAPMEHGAFKIIWECPRRQGGAGSGAGLQKVDHVCGVAPF